MLSPMTGPAASRVSIAAAKLERLNGIVFIDSFEYGISDPIETKNSPPNNRSKPHCYIIIVRIATSNDRPGITISIRLPKATPAIRLAF